MKRSIEALLVLSFVALGAANAMAQPGAGAPPPSQPPAPSPWVPQQASGPYADNSGFTIGFGFGVSTIDCVDDCESETAVAFDLEIGGFLNPRLALLFDFATYIDSEDGVTSSLGTNTLALKYYAAPALWVKGGIGLSEVGIDIDGVGSDSEYGFGSTAAVGYEVMRTGRGFAIDVSSRLSFMSFEEATTDFYSLNFVVGARWK